MNEQQYVTPEPPSSQDEFFFTSTTPVRDRLFGRRRKHDWVEDTFIDYSFEESTKSNKNYLGLGVSKTMMRLFLAIIIVGLSGLVARAGYVQVAKGDAYLAQAESNRLRTYFMVSPRGLLYDRSGKLLVVNVPSFSLYVIPVDFPKDETDRETRIREILAYFPQEKEAIETVLRDSLAISPLRKEYYQPQVIRSSIDYDQAIRLRVESSHIPGITVETEQQRLYATSDLQNISSLSHIIGYVGRLSADEYDELEGKGYLYRDVMGKTGVELFYEEALRGSYGTRQVEVDSMGKEIKELSREPVTKGQNLVLTIDIAAQQKLEQLLKNELDSLHLKRGVAIAEDPRTGDILAMVSLPSYDNNLFAKGIDRASYQALLNDPDKPLYNRSISGEFPSGSTIKPIYAAAALQEKIISAATQFVSVGGIRIGQWFFPDWQAGGHGLTDVRKSLAQSVNTFYYIICGGYQGTEGLGPSRMKEYAELFGLGNRTGIDLPNEKAGFLPSPAWKQSVKDEPWYIGDTYHMAIGQGDVVVTPLQVSNYMAAFANGGTLLKPRVVRAITPAGATDYTPREPEIIQKEFIDSYNMSVVRQGLRQTIMTGSGRALNSLPVTSAGKTGTAQWGLNKPPHAWFTAFAPYEKPEIVVTVLIEEGEEGSKVAVPVVNDFLQWYFTQYNRP